MFVVLVRSPRALRVDRRDLFRLAVFGVVGVAAARSTVSVSRTR
jgi:hypothetical protein